MFSVCYVTTPSMELARELSRIIVSNKAAACVNILPSVTSVFSWEGRVTEESECLMMIKTRTALVEEVIALVKAHHTYDVPEVISVPIGPGNEAYLSWVRESTTRES